MNIRIYRTKDGDELQYLLGHKEYVPGKGWCDAWAPVPLVLSDELIAEQQGYCDHVWDDYRFVEVKGQIKPMSVICCSKCGVDK